MLNPAFPLQGDERQLSRYVLEAGLADRSFQGNATLSSGPEWRLQEVYEIELWKKVESLNLAIDWEKADVLDVCSGTGFLSFHLLKRVRPRSLTLLDASCSELQEAKRLLRQHYPGLRVRYVVADLMNSSLPTGVFDLLIGNSFLHHMYNMPYAVKEFHRLLKPGGRMATLHEPTPAAIAYESGSWNLARQFLSEGAGYVETLRRAMGDGHPNCIDVWLLEPERIRAVFEAEGFKQVMVRGWHIVRPFVVAAQRLHLDQGKPVLTAAEVLLLRMAIKSDALLRHLLPLHLFGSLALSARKPTT